MPATRKAKAEATNNAKTALAAATEAAANKQNSSSAASSSSTFEGLGDLKNILKQALAGLVEGQSGAAAKAKAAAAAKAKAKAKAKAAAAPYSSSNGQSTAVDLPKPLPSDACDYFQVGKCNKSEADCAHKHVKCPKALAAYHYRIAMLQKAKGREGKGKGKCKGEKGKTGKSAMVLSHALAMDGLQ